MLTKLNAGLLGAFFILVALLLLVDNDIIELLSYSRIALLQGEAWRVVSGHLVHVNIMHGLMNLAALALIVAVVGKQLRAWQWWLAGAALCVCISLGLWFFSSEVEWYVGLSGVLHGLLGLGLALSAYRGDRLHALALLGLLAKVAYEQLPSFDVNHLQDVIGAAVVVDAHLYGCISGVFMAAGAIIRQSKR